MVTPPVQTIKSVDEELDVLVVIDEVVVETLDAVVRVVEDNVVVVVVESESMHTRPLVPVPEAIIFGKLSQDETQEPLYRYILSSQVRHESWNGATEHRPQKEIDEQSQSMLVLRVTERPRHSKEQNRPTLVDSLAGTV